MLILILWKKSLQISLLYMVIFYSILENDIYCCVLLYFNFGYSFFFSMWWSFVFRNDSNLFQKLKYSHIKQLWLKSKTYKRRPMVIDLKYSMQKKNPFKIFKYEGRFCKDFFLRLTLTWAFLPVTSINS